jgi:hypothetical protein
MEFYVYISSSKLEQLLPKYCPELFLSRKYSGKLKLPTAELGYEESTPPPDSLVQKARAIDEWFVKEGIDAYEVGDIYGDRPNIRDTMMMRWGVFPPNAPTRVFFVGECDNTIVGLVGRARHVYGNAAPSTDPREFLESLGLNVQVAVDQLLGTNSNTPQMPADTLSAVVELNNFIKSPSQRFQFLAIVLDRRIIAGRRVVLASPVYVMLVT